MCVKWHFFAINFPAKNWLHFCPRHSEQVDGGKSYTAVQNVKINKNCRGEESLVYESNVSLSLLNHSSNKKKKSSKIFYAEMPRMRWERGSMHGRLYLQYHKYLLHGWCCDLYGRKCKVALHAPILQVFREFCLSLGLETAAPVRREGSDVLVWNGVSFIQLEVNRIPFRW